MALAISVGNSYTEYQLMHTFLDNFHKGKKYSARMASHQAELRKEENFGDKKSLSISESQIDYLNWENSVRNNERAQFSQTRCNNCGGSQPTEKCFTQQRKGKGYTKPPFNPRNSNNKPNELNGRKLSM